MEIKIYFDEDTEYSEFMYYNKDYRLGIIVEHNNRKYKLNIYGITRLNQEFNDCLHNNEVFYIEPDLIIVEEVNKENIINSILGVCKGFDFLSQLKVEDKLDLSKYVNVYSSII